MGLTVRHYIFQDDSTLKRIPRRIIDALPSGTEAIPEYAGQRTAQMLLENGAALRVKVPRRSA